MAFVGQTALVVGGSSGMGRGAARAFAEQGGNVVVTSRSADGAARAAAAVAETLVPVDGIPGGRVSGVCCDLADPQGVAAAVRGLEGLDHLVVTAAPGAGGTDRDFFDGKFWGTQAAAAAAAERLPDHGTMLFASGGMAVRPAAGSWSVTCAFAAVEALARALAVDLAPRRVNCIRPGLFDTATWARLAPAERERFMAERSDALPARRAGSEADFGAAFLAHLRCGFLTGQVIALDGGESLLSA